MLMNTNTSFKANEIITMKLITGEEIITKYLEDAGFNYKVHKPLVLSVTPQGVAMTPFLFTAEIEGSIEIPKSAVIAATPTEKSTAGQYIKGTTGIVPASPKSMGKLL
jgi:hypothetical protein